MSGTDALNRIIFKFTAELRNNWWSSVTDGVENKFKVLAKSSFSYEGFINGTYFS